MGIRPSEGAAFFRPWPQASMQSKMTQTMILTRSSSVHDREEIDSHGDGVEHRQGLQTIRYWVFLQ